MLFQFLYLRNDDDFVSRFIEPIKSVLFNGYLNDPERTSNAFAIINNQVYLRMGHLALYNKRAGRVDFQIKIRGQRVETTEIEDTSMNPSLGKISNCLATKIPQMDDVLVAYVISNESDLDTEEIRDCCNKHLRQYMVPSYFIVLDKFLLNFNGKIGRKQLPLPASIFGVPTDGVQIEDQSISKFKKRVHSLCYSAFRINNISRHMNCFTLGGSSLSLMQFFNYYQFHLVPEKQLSVHDFFVYPTIADHVQLLNNRKSKTRIVWNPLHLEQGMCSLRIRVMLKYLTLYRRGFICSETSLDGRKNPFQRMDQWTDICL